MAQRPSSKWLFAAALSAVLAACAQPAAMMPAGSPVMKLDAAGLAERMANPMVVDWSSRVIASAAVERLRQARPAGADRRVQALAATSTLGEGFAGSPASGRVSPPAINMQTRQAFWVAENGWLLRRDLNDGTEVALPISAVDGAAPTDTFPKTNVTLSKDGKRVYLCSAQGNVFALDAQTGKNLINSPYAMGETAVELGYTPAPCVDPVSSSAAGDVETLYAISNLGSLHRFLVDGTGTNSPAFMVHAQSTSYTSWGGCCNEFSTPGTYVFPMSPVAIAGKVYLTHRGRETRMWYGVGMPVGHTPAWPGMPMNNGNVLVYDTGVKTPTMTPLSGKYIGMLPDYWTPYTQPPVIQVNEAFEPHAFFSASFTGLRMNELADMDSPGMYGGYTSGQIYVTNDAPDSGLKWNTKRDGMGLTFCSPVALDPVKSRAFTVMGNALFQVAYDVPAIAPADDSEFYWRGMTFGNRSTQWYTKTAQGRSVGVALNGVQIQSMTPPYFDGTHVWVLDQNAQPGLTTRLVLNRFLPGDGAAPTLVESTALTDLAPDAAVPDGTITIDPLTKALRLNTRSATPGQSRLWRIAP